MTSVYFDASAFLPLFVDDSFAARAENILEADVEAVVVSDWTVAESASALAKFIRMTLLTPMAAREICAAIETWVGRNADRAEIRPADIREAEALIRRFELNLRTPDALHIAVARRLGLPLATFDRKMAESARSLGVEVIEA